MKLIWMVVALLLSGCGSKTESKAGTGDSQKEEMIRQGESLVASNDCKTCHHSVNKIIGPAHLDVAKKYEFTPENVNLLADRIIKGGSGVWGELPMTAHPDLSVEDARKIARYILSLDGESEK
jgi:cytochrome c